MPPMNLQWSIFGRPIKPVSLVLMNTMLILGYIAIADNGILGDSEWADVVGMIAFGVAFLFILGFYKFSQTLAEWALLGAFFVWSVRLWAIIITQGWDVLTRESGFLALMWALLAGGSWLLERSDTLQHMEGKRGTTWSRP